MNDHISSRKAMNGMIVAINLFKFLVASSHKAEVFNQLQMKESTVIRFDKDHVLELIQMLKPMIVVAEHQKKAKRQILSLVEVMKVCEWLEKDLPKELDALLNETRSTCLDAGGEHAPQQLGCTDKTSLFESASIISLEKAIKSRTLN